MSIADTVHAQSIGVDIIGIFVIILLVVRVCVDRLQVAIIKGYGLSVKKEGRPTGRYDLQVDPGIVLEHGIPFDVFDDVLDVVLEKLPDSLDVLLLFWNIRVGMLRIVGPLGGGDCRSCCQCNP